MNNNNQFIRRLYNKYLYSSMLAILTSALGQIVSNMIAGVYVGVTALSVTVITIPVYYIFATVGNLLGAGGSTLCSRFVGKGEYARCRQTFTMTYALAVLSAAALGGFAVAFLPNILRLFGVTPELFADAYSYSMVMITGGVFTICIYLAFAFLRLEGRTITAALVFLIMAAVTIALGGFLLISLSFGVAGVAIANTAGAAASAITGAVLLFRGGRNLSLVKVPKKDMLPIARDILRLGSPGALENLSILLCAMTINYILVSSFGELALSANSVIGSVNSFALIITAGISGAIMPFVGVFSAELDTASIKQVLRLALVKGMIFAGAFTALCIAFAGPIGALFGMGGPDARAILTPAIIMLALSLPFSLVNSILIALHTANGVTWVANVLTVLKYFAFIALPALLLYTPLGVSGVFSAVLLGNVLTLLVAVIIHLVSSRHYDYRSMATLLDERAEKLGHCVSFSAYNNIDSIMDCVSGISAFCEQNQLSQQQSMLIALSLEEMLSSISAHSLSGAERGVMAVRMLIINDTIVIRIRNSGADFNPLLYYEQKLKALNPDDPFAMLELEDSLGIKMILETTTNVDYRRTFGVNNLTIVL